MTYNINLSDADNLAFAVMTDHENAGRYCIRIGNIREGDLPATIERVTADARKFFGNVEESGSAKGTADRWEMFVVVEHTDDQSILRFMRQKLGGSASQFKPTLQ